MDGLTLAQWYEIKANAASSSPHIRTTVFSRHSREMVRRRRRYGDVSPRAHMRDNTSHSSIPPVMLLSARTAGTSRVLSPAMFAAASDLHN